MLSAKSQSRYYRFGHNWHPHRSEKRYLTKTKREALLGDASLFVFE
jgi:hypothetical protein